MRKVLLAFACYGIFLSASLFRSEVNAQTVPSDSSLLSLVKKYVHSPVQRTVAANGDVFLQRDLGAYLRSTVQSPEVPASEKDFGHDHKDEMLRTFLNRPHPNVATMNKYFEDAALEFGVPASILKANGLVQSNWAQVSESIYGSWGVMGLIENYRVQQISKAAALLGVDPQAIKNDAKTNIRAAAALLASYQPNKAAAIEGWFEAVASLTGLWDEAMKHELTVRIYDVMKNGSKTVTLWGEIINLESTGINLPKSDREWGITQKEASNMKTTATDYPNAISNFTTCNYNSRPAGSTIKYYFVHYVATGTYQGAISWFKDCSSNVSAHYVVRNSDGQVSQVVAESNRAWSQGVATYNDLGIGVEHEVLATNLAMWDSEPMLNAAASLCRDVCNRRGLPKVRRVNNGDLGIYGHSDVRSTDCPNLTDARWANFITRVNSVSITAPTLYSIQNSGAGTQMIATWKANIEPTLAGYRLYYATNDALSNWALAADETTLTAATTSVTLTAAQFLVPPTGDVYHFKLTAIVTDPSNGNQKVESSGSDIYSRSSNTTGSKVLIVDGFDRFGGSGSWASSTHSFATSYFKSLRNKAPLQISTAANEKVEDGTVPLSNYDIVVWFVGDESSVDSVFTVNEKAAIRNYLNGGGKLLVSGSEIAYILGRAASAARDSAFINNYLKANYLSDGASTYTPATGVAATPFAGLTLPFGVVYPEDFPDAIAAVNGSAPILKYNGVTTHGGVAYKGTFGSGTTPGAVIYLSFTLETAADATITSFMEKALTYFGETIVTTPVATDDAATAQTGKAKRIGVLANDVTNGVAFTPTTLTIVDQPGNGTASVDAAGSITYISNPGFTGNDSYSYKVQNADGQFSNTATVTITVISALNCDPAAPEVDDAAPKRDLRGAWIATVSNIDWPIRLQTPAQQQAHLIRLLDSLAAVNINAVFLQVRPEADALYASTIEPWSYWLTNNQGVAPSPLWDPLSFAIDAAHARGMELHAWFNPFRAKQSTPTLAANHVVNQHPEWILDIPTSVPSKILDPGLPAVRQYVTDVVIDVATRYDVDGIHFDDYFYPDVITNQDDASFAANNPTSIATKADWRRNNSSLMVAKVYDAIQALNTSTGRNVVFGVSPFGIWKSGTPAGITGNSSYTNQFYDPIAWLQAGKVDYLAPQLYWKITGPQDYNILSKWWNDQGYTYNRYIYPGLALYKMVDANNFPASETQNQIILNRDQSREQIRGQVFYSSKYITANTKGIFTALLANEYKYKALPPAMPWKDAVCPNAPVNVRRDGDTLRWDAPAPATDGDLPRRYVVYRFANMAEATTNLNDASKIYSIVYNNRVGLPTGDLNSYFLVTSVDKNNNESEAGGGILLPVIGLNLTVKLSGNTAVIQWTTITEINTKTFDVERSTDGRNFRYLTSVTAAGNSNSVRNYGAQDFLTEDGTYYYRIKTIDHDGKVSYSGLKSIVYRSSRNEIVLGPNPFESGINISNLQGVKRLEVVDLSGRVLVSRPLANQQNIRLDMPQLPAGSYQLKVLKANGELTYVKLIKL